MEEQVPRRTSTFWLTPEQYDEFIDLLEQPPGDMEKTKKLFQRPSPFTRDCD